MANKIRGFGCNAETPQTVEKVSNRQTCKILFPSANKSEKLAFRRPFQIL